MAKKGFDPTNLTELATDPLMDQTIGAIVGTQAENNLINKEVSSKGSQKNASNSSKKNNTSKKKATVTNTSEKKDTENINQREINASSRSKKSKKKSEESADNHIPYNYRKEERDIEGVGVVEKVISENGKIIGRPNVPAKEKKKPITLTLMPELYEEVKERAAADRRTTSEYLAIIIEEYLKK